MAILVILAVLGLALAVPFTSDDTATIEDDAAETPETDDEGTPSGNDLLADDDTGDDPSTPPVQPPQPPFGDTLLDETLAGTTGADTVNGGSGDDTLRGLGGDDTLFGDEAPRIGTGSAWNGNDLLDGGDGNDWLAGNGGNDTLLGGAGDDLIADYDPSWFEGDNASLVDGGTGNDAIGVDGGSTVTGGAGNGSISFYISDRYNETSVITDFDPDADQLNVVLSVSDGPPLAFSLSEAVDEQTYELRNGDDVLARIIATRAITMDDLTLVVQVAQGVGGIEVVGDDSGLLLVGGSLDDTVIGSNGDDAIILGEEPFGIDNAYRATTYPAGNDLGLGGDGNDTLVAQGGWITYYYPDDYATERTERIDESYRDTLNGGAGDDFLFSYNGSDLIGGAGADTFGIVHAPSQDEIPPAEILDFNPAEDRITVQLGPLRDLPDPDAVRIEVWDDGLGSDLYLDDFLIARVTGGQTLLAGDIVQVDRILA